MKAIVHHEYGEPVDVLRLEDVVTPAPSGDEVLVRVRAAGVNWADAAMTRGLPYMLRLGAGLRRPRRGIRGTDVAGTVAAVGETATHLRPGDDVVGWCVGAFAEHVCVPEDHLVHKPAGIGFEEAAALPMAGFCALQALRDVGRLEAGQSVLVNGASGGIGTFAVQIAKALGTEVTGVCSTANLDLVRSLGADHVLDYTREDFTRGEQRYDLILDIADTRTLAERRRVLAPHGTLIPNNGDGGRWIASLGRIVRARLLSPFLSQRLRPFLSLPRLDDLRTLADMVDAGDITHVVGRTYPLADTSRAVAHVGAGHTRGKVVIAV